MGYIADNPIKKHYLGLPCMFGDSVGRIVGEAEEGSWANVNGENCFSIPLFSTPHGTIIKTGKFFLGEITEAGMTKLKEYEQQVRDSNGLLYGGRLKEIEDIL